MYPEKQNEIEAVDPLIGRMGILRISLPLLREKPSMFLPLFSVLVVLESKYHWPSNSIEYLGLSKHFKIKLEGMEAPVYECIFRTTDEDDGGDDIFVGFASYGTATQ